MITTASIGLVTIECAKCGITFAMPSVYERARRNDHDTFYCPSGHGNHFPGKSEEEKLRDRLASERNLREGAERRADATERSLRATKGVITKMKKRIGAGVCPCCNRHFTALERHMATQHPEYRDHS